MIDLQKRENREKYAIGQVVGSPHRRIIARVVERTGRGSKVRVAYAGELNWDMKSWDEFVIFQDDTRAFHDDCYTGTVSCALPELLVDEAAAKALAEGTFYDMHLSP